MNTQIRPKNNVVETSPITSTDSKSIRLCSAKAVVLTVLMLFILTFAQAATKTWNVTTGGSWRTDSNWTPAGAPVDGDDVIIPADQSGQINQIPTISLNSLTVNGTCTLLASRYAMTITGTFFVQNGKTLTYRVQIPPPAPAIALAAGSTGSIEGFFNLYSSGSTFTCSGDLTIAPGSYIDGPGTFTLNSGATLRTGSPAGITTSGPTGSIQVTGTRIYSAGANYEYNGTAAQVTGNGLMSSTPANLTINNSAGVTLSETTTVTGLLTISGGILHMPGSDLTAGSLTGSGNIDALSGIRTLTIGSDGTSPPPFSGIISNGTATSVALTKTGTGTMVLSGASSYTGITTISAGTLKLGGSGSGVDSPLGTITAGTSVATGAVLDLNGYSLTTAEPLTLRGNGISEGGALTNSSASDATYSGLITLGSGTSIIASPGNIILSNTGTILGTPYSLTLGGTATGCILASNITTGVGQITKSGTGTWTISGTTSIGATTISGGILQLGAAERISNSSNCILNSGSFSTGAVTGYSETVNLLTLNENSTIALGTGNHTLKFAASSSQTWITGKRLTITGWEGSWDGTTGTSGKIYFGSDASGLTLDQLNEIRFRNSTGSFFPAIILPTGEVVPNSSQTIEDAISTSGTYIIPACVTSITVKVWGAGGKGGDRTTPGVTGGGGGGAFSSGTISVTPGTSYNVTVGVGSTSTAPGGDSWFNNASTILAKGGNSVTTPNNPAGAAGGASSAGVGTTKYSGGTGGTGSGTNAGGGGSSAGTAANGTNGSAPAGGIAPAGGGNGGYGRSGVGGNGWPGYIPGGGGGGSYSVSLSRTGGKGADGRIIVSYTVPTPSIMPESIPDVCIGSTSANLNYTVIRGCPDQYSINYDAAAEAVGFTDVINAPLEGSPIVLTIPDGNEAGTFNGILSVRTSFADISSVDYAISVTVRGPQGTLTGNSICSGGAGQFTFTATSGTGPFDLIINGQNYSGVISGTPFNAVPNPTITTNYTLTSITSIATGCIRTSGITGPSATISLSNQWTGTIDTDWGTAGNWSCNAVPSSSSDAVIPFGAANMPVITIPNAVCNNLTIDGTLTIGSGGILTATRTTSSGIFTIDPFGIATIDTLINNGILNLNSSSPSGIFSLMMDSYSGSGLANVQLFLTGGGAPNHNWHYVSVPVDDLSKSYFTDIEPYNLMAYNDSRVDSTDFNGWSWHDGYGGYPRIGAGGGFSTLTYGRGYNFYHDIDATVNFTGMPSLGTTLGSVSLQYSGSTPDNPIFGLNLLGNSLTCSLDWNNVILYGPVSETVYYTTADMWASYNRALSSGTNGGTKNIPPLQGFFVKATSFGASVDLRGAKEHSSQPRYKKSGDVQETSKNENIYPKVKLELSGSGTSDETIVWFNDEATTGFDDKFDGYKLFRNDAPVGQLYSILGGINYVINGIPLSTDPSFVPLGVNITQAGNYSLLKKDLVIPDGYNVFLIDKTNNHFSVNLKNTDEYFFSTGAGIFRDRFVLKISSSEGRSEDQKDFNIYAFNKIVNIIPLNSLINGLKGEVKVFDLTGRVIKHVKNVEWHEGDPVSISCNEQQGIYMVEVSSGTFRQVGKIFLH